MWLPSTVEAAPHTSRLFWTPKFGVRLRSCGMSTLSFAVEVGIVPPHAGVPIAAEISDKYAKQTLLHGATDAAGRVVMHGRFGSGAYLVQAFSASTADVGAAETQQVTFIIP